MSVRFSHPAPIRGDIKLLGSGAGLLTATPVQLQFEAGSFDIPGLTEYQEILIIVEGEKTAFSIENQQFSTSETSADNFAASPGSLRSNNTIAWCQSRCFKSIQAGNSKMNYTNIIHTGAISAGTSNLEWGDVSAPKTIYVNITSGTIADIYYKWAAYLIGGDVK